MHNVYLIKNCQNVGKCQLEDDGDDVFLSGVVIYKKFRGLGYCVKLINKATYRYKKKNNIARCQY